MTSLSVSKTNTCIYLIHTLTPIQPVSTLIQLLWDSAAIQKDLPLLSPQTESDASSPIILLLSPYVIRVWKQGMSPFDLYFCVNILNSKVMCPLLFLFYLCMQIESSTVMAPNSLQLEIWTNGHGPWVQGSFKKFSDFSFMVWVQFFQWKSYHCSMAEVGIASLLLMPTKV